MPVRSPPAGPLGVPVPVPLTATEVSAVTLPLASMVITGIQAALPTGPVAPGPVSANLAEANVPETICVASRLTGSLPAIPCVLPCGVVTVTDLI